MTTPFRVTLIAAAAAIQLSACAAPTPTQVPVKLETEEQKTFYALGLEVGRNLTVFKLSPEELELVKKGLSDATAGKPQVEPQAYQTKVREMARARQMAVVEKEKEKAKAFAAAAAKEPGAVQTPSGLVYKTLKEGSGPSPSATDTVKVHYHGTLADGTVFDSSVKRGQPAEFPLNHVVPCWTEGVQKMKIGEKAKLTCPSAIAYGDRGSPPTIPGGATLTFEVELLEIKPPAPATTPMSPPTNPHGGLTSPPPGTNPRAMPPGNPHGTLQPPPAARASQPATQPATQPAADPHKH